MPENETSGDIMMHERARPESAYDSVLLMGEQLPVRQGFDFWRHYTRRQQFETSTEARQLADDLARNPQQLSGLLNYFDEVAATALENEDIEGAKAVGHTAKGLVEYVGKHFRRKGKDIQPEAKEWLTLAVHDSHAEAYRQILGQFMEAERPEEESVSFLYDLCLASMEDDEAKTFMLKMLHYDTKYYHANSATETAYLRSFYSDNDERLKKAMEIDAFAGLVAPIYLDLETIQRGKQTRFHQLGRPRIMNEIQRQMRANPRRIKQLFNFYDLTRGDEISGTMAPVKPEQAKDFPFNLILEQQGPLLAAANEEMAKYKPVKGYELITTPQYATAFHLTEGDHSFDKIRDMLRRGYNKEAPTRNGGHLEMREIKTVIAYLRDEVKGVAEVGELMSLKKEHVEAITTDFRRPLSPRGNVIMIEDPMLREYGYKHLLFRDSDKDGERLVRVTLGGYYFDLGFDENYNLVNPKNGDRLDKGEGAADGIGTLVMQTWILGHLRELLCKETDELMNDNVPSEERAEFKRAYLNRVGHVRTVKRMDFVPNREQRELAFSEQGWNMLEKNKRREALGKFPYTYVRKVDNKPIEATLPPVRSYATGSATEEYRKALGHA